MDEFSIKNNLKIAPLAICLEIAQNSLVDGGILACFPKLQTVPFIMLVCSKYMGMDWLLASNW